MPTREFKRERIPHEGRFGRNIFHDSKSRRFAFDTSGLEIVTAEHQIHIPTLDQGNIGSCVANTGLTAICTDPYWRTLTDWNYYSRDEAGALALYHDLTLVDPYEGEWPPTDTGSDGLTCATVLKRVGAVSGFQHTFSLDDALRALGQFPNMTGINWYSGMYSPDATGRVRPSGNRVGGHEVLAYGIDADNEQVWFSNPWGPTWGLDGRFWMSFDDYGALLERDGDVIILVPLTMPAPIPTPDEDDNLDATLAAAFRRGDWCDRWHWSSGSRRVAKAAREWMEGRQL